MQNPDSETNQHLADDANLLIYVATSGIENKCTRSVARVKKIVPSIEAENMYMQSFPHVGLLVEPVRYTHTHTHTHEIHYARRFHTYRALLRYLVFPLHTFCHSLIFERKS